MSDDLHICPSNPTGEMIEVNSVDEIPDFTSEREEQDFWCKHTFGPGLMEQVIPLDDLLPPPRSCRPTVEPRSSRE